jgi:hypothetical protein
MGYVGYGTGASTSLDRGAGTPIDTARGGDPGQQFYAQQNYPSQGDSFYGGLSGMASLYGPSQQYTQDLGNQQYLNLQQQMNLIQGGEDYQSGLVNQSADFSRRNLGLSREQLGVRQGALSRQMEMMPQQFGLQNQRFDLSQEQANQGATNQTEDLNSQLTARGTYVGPGADRGRGRIQEQLAFATRGIGLERHGAALNQKEQMAQGGDAQKMLDIASKQLGISGEEIEARLTNALAQIGMGGAMSANQLLGEFYKMQQGQMSAYAPMLGDINRYAGMVIPTWQPSG